MCLEYVDMGSGCSQGFLTAGLSMNTLSVMTSDLFTDLIGRIVQHNPLINVISYRRPVAMMPLRSTGIQ